MLWGTEYLGRQQQPGRTNLPATPQRAAGNSSEQWGGPGFTLLPDQSVAHHTIRYSSHSSESKKEKLCSDYKREQEEIKKLIEFHCRSNPELKYVVLFIKKKNNNNKKKNIVVLICITVQALCRTITFRTITGVTDTRSYKMQKSTHHHRGFTWTTFTFIIWHNVVHFKGSVNQFCDLWCLPLTQNHGCEWNSFCRIWKNVNS